VGFVSLNPIILGAKGEYSIFGKEFYLPDPTVTTLIMNKTVYRKAKLLTHYIEEEKRKVN
jgi:hypothetical protein